MKLPKEFVDEYLEKAKGSTLFGFPIETLERRELIAGLVCMGESERLAREQGQKTVDFLLEMNRIYKRG